ncbi:hypothetical protein V6N13_135180 [Hibiscus sabdariffa]
MQVLSDLITALCHETALRPPAKMFSYLKQALLDEGKKNMAINLARKTDKPRGTPLVDGGHNLQQGDNPHVDLLLDVTPIEKAR